MSGRGRSTSIWQGAADADGMRGLTVRLRRADGDRDSEGIYGKLVIRQPWICSRRTGKRATDSVEINRKSIRGWKEEAFTGKPLKNNLRARTETNGGTTATATGADRRTGGNGLFDRLFSGDKPLWIIVISLAIISLLVVYSSTASMAYKNAGGNTAHYFFNQLKFIAIAS